MSSAGENPSDKRYDCFISFHGSQDLSDLGFKRGDGLDCTVRQLASEVDDRLREFSPQPSVFFDQREIDGHWPDYLSHAILQLRGGGVALVLLTTEYLASKYCLAELRAFLELERLRFDGGRKGEAIDVRVAVLEERKRAIPDALEDVALKDFVGAKLGRVQCTRLPDDNRKTLRLVVDAICLHVENIWNSKKGICLGRDIDNCVDNLADSFPARHRHRLARKLGFTGEDFLQGMSVDSIFFKALEEGRLSNSSYLSNLSNANFGVAAKKALAAFRRKWCSSAWEWSLAPERNGICLAQFLSDAEDALRRRHRPAEHGSSPSRHQIPQPGLMKERAEGASEREGYKVARVPREQGPQWEKGSASAATGDGRFEGADDFSDSFHPFFPAQSRLDSALVPGAATCLAQLKAAVLPITHHSGDGPPDEGLTGIASGDLNLGRVALISLNGEGGVGKTSACKLLCADADIRSFFEDGAILWIEFGRDANEEKVVGALGMAVSSCGGNLAAKRIRELGSVSEAVEHAREFFGGRRLLVLLDYVVETPAGSRVQNWAAALSKITDFPGSAIIMTTRSSCLAQTPGFHCVRLGRLDLETEGSPDSSIAEDLYDALVNETAEKQACDGYRNNRRKALRLSCGLPLGIATFACLVRTYAERGDAVGDVLANIENRTKALTRSSESVGDDQKPRLVATIGHAQHAQAGLNAAMKESLSFLNKQKRQHFAVESEPLPLSEDECGSDSLVFRASYEAFPDNFFSARYAALKVMPASSLRLPFEVLCHLWHVRTVPQVKEIAAAFADIGLGRIEGGGESGPEIGFALHDLQFEFCAGLYRSSHEFVDGHALLLSSCHSLLVPKSVEAGAAVWAKFCFEDLQSSNAALRDYLSNNLIRHICSAVPAGSSSSFGEKASSFAALKQEVLSLLFNFCWLRGRFSSQGGRKAVLRDLSSALDSGFLGDSDTDSLCWLKKIVMQVSDDALGGSGGSLASFLVQMAQSVEAETCASDAVFFKQLSIDAAKDALGAWFKPISGCCLPFERGVLKTTAMDSSGVQFVSPLGDGTHFVALNINGMVGVYDYSFLVADLVLENIRAIRFMAVCHQGYADKSRIIFSVDMDGAVRWSRISFDETELALVSNSSVVGRSNSPPTVLFASKDGKFVAVGCGDGIVCVWEPNGGNSGSYALKVRFLCSDADEGGKDGVNCLVVSGSGDFVAACTSSGGVYFWREEEGSVERVARLKSPEGGFLFHIVAIFLSSDDKSLFVLNAGSPAYEIWDVEAGKRRSARIALPELRRIGCTYLAERGAGQELELSLLVGGEQTGGGFCVAEYSIRDELEIVRTCRLLTVPFSVCTEEFTCGTGPSRFVVGGMDGSVRVLDAGAFDISPSLEQSESYMQVEKYASLCSSAQLGRSRAVAVLPEAGFVIAGHIDGRLSLWSAGDGSFQRVIDSEREASSVNCIDISAKESVAVTGHENGIALVWEVSTWTVKCALEVDVPVTC